MARFVVGRLTQMIATLAIVAVIAFGLARLAGDPVPLLMPAQASQADLDFFRNQLGLDRPVPEQFVRFVGNIARGDFGNSFRYDQPALTLVLDRLPATIYLALTAMGLAALIGLPLGITAAVWRNTWLDTIIRTAATIGQSTPLFWLALMLMLVFSVMLRWTPTSGYGTFAHFILPTLTLGWFSAASIARITRSSMIEVLQSDFVRLERLCGLPHRLIVLKHALRNAAAPIVTFMALQLGALLGGAVITETIFSWPGFGQLMVNAILFRDFPVIQAAIIVTALFFLTINFLVDITYRLLDPRVRI
jgi:peptide/nickel transport system permease protein